MSDLFVLDSSVLIDDLRTGRHDDRIRSLDGILRTCSVVLAELWRGAVSEADRVFLRSLERNYRVFTPTERNWLESGRLLTKIRADKGFEPHKVRDLHFDVLIALTARTHGRS